jgi:hypothetical protein
MTWRGAFGCFPQHADVAEPFELLPEAILTAANGIENQLGAPALISRAGARNVEKIPWLGSVGARSHRLSLWTDQLSDLEDRIISGSLSSL